MVTISEELKAAIEAGTTEGYGEWKNSANAEQIAAGKAEMEKFTTDEAFGNQLMEEIKN